MSLKDEFLELDPQGATQAAYDRAAHPVFNGKALHPWTEQRKAIAMTLDCHVMRFVGPEASEFLAKGSYPNTYRDVMRMLYLSSLDSEELLEMECVYDMRRAYLPKMYEWCESIGLKYGNKLFLEGVELLDVTLRDILDSMPFFTESGNGVKKKENTDPPGNSGSSPLP